MLDHHQVIEDLKSAFGDETDEAFAARFLGARGGPMTRPALRVWREKGIPVSRMLEIARLLNGRQWPESFAALYRATVPAHEESAA